MHKAFKLKILFLSLPVAAGFLIFYIIPFFRSIGYSFLKSANSR